MKQLIKPWYRKNLLGLIRNKKNDFFNLLFTQSTYQEEMNKFCQLNNSMQNELRKITQLDDKWKFDLLTNGLLIAGISGKLNRNRLFILFRI